MHLIIKYDTAPGNNPYFVLITDKDTFSADRE
jgi:hypothetical protein